MSAGIFAQSLLRQIDETIAETDAHLVSGTPQDWAAYRAMVGKRQGLLIAREAVTERLAEDFEITERD